MKAAEKKMAKIRVDGVTYQIPKERLEMERLLKRGVLLAQRIERLSQELAEVKETMLPFGEAEMKVSGLKSAKLIGAAGMAEVTVQSSFSIADANVPAILEVLGEDVGAAMVLQKIAHKPSTAMKRLLAHGDDPRGVKLRRFVHVKESRTVRFVGK